MLSSGFTDQLIATVPKLIRVKVTPDLQVFPGPIWAMIGLGLNTISGVASDIHNCTGTVNSLLFLTGKTICPLEGFLGVLFNPTMFTLVRMSCGWEMSK